nr:uncharacterized protein LOC128674215 isoform X2 [Plodia interpunctella]
MQVKMVQSKTCAFSLSVNDLRVDSTDLCAIEVHVKIVISLFCTFVFLASIELILRSGSLKEVEQCWYITTCLEIRIFVRGKKPQRKVWALKLCVYVFLLFATYITIMGWIGLVHYIRTGDVTMHFLLAAIFGCMTLSLITVVCNDVYIIFTYIYMLRSNTINTRTNNNPTNTEPLAVTQEDKNPENATPKVTDIP